MSGHIWNERKWLVNKANNLIFHEPTRGVDVGEKPERLTMLNKELLRIVRDSFALDTDGIHGESHWMRVFETGISLAAKTGAIMAVVELFALLHDSCRMNDGRDPEHGSRAAVLARSLAGSVFVLPETELELLAAACRGHTKGGRVGDITVLTCWDADRLDLGRVGIKPRPDRLCTDAARNPEFLAWAYERSRAGDQSPRR